MSDAVRLSRRVAALVPCSRREAEQYIEGGWVQVDGALVETPQTRVQAQQNIVIDPAARPVPIVPVTLLLHKPPGDDWEHGGKQSAARLLVPQNHWGQDRSGTRVLQRHLALQQCVTPLESAASGLLVYSQEWPIRRKLLEDAALVENEVIVEVQGAVSEAALAQLRRSPVIDGRAMLAAKVSVTSAANGVTGLRFAMKGNYPGQLAQMCTQAGLTILSMRRIRVGRLPLAKLPPGQWRFLLPAERF